MACHQTTKRTTWPAYFTSDWSTVNYKLFIGTSKVESFLFVVVNAYSFVISFLKALVLCLLLLQV